MNLKSRSMFLILALSVSVLFGFASCKSSPSSENSKTSNVTVQSKVKKGPGEVSVMTFNVENMFDNIHNADVGDFTYLPRAAKNTPEAQEFCNKMSNSYYKNDCLTKNWDDEAVRFKLSQVAKTIKYVDEGNGPDNLIMAEVENENVLNLLVKNHLAGLGYQTVSILKGPDTRGINTAFISKFPMVGKPVLHLIPYHDSDPEMEKQAKKSRGILETTVKINNKNVTFLAAHFPSQSNPSEWRRQAMEHMKTLMLDLESKGQSVIAGGDLNTIPQEERDGGYFSKILSQGGAVSHLVGCKQCTGSHYYHGEWSFLDVMVYSHNLTQTAGLTLIPDSIEVVKSPHHTKANGTPLRFDEIKKEGVSDHFPIYSRLKSQ